MFGKRNLPTRRTKATASLPENTTTVASPRTKKRRIVVQKTIKLKALEELLITRASNGGQRRGDIQNIVTAYQNDGFPYVTRRSMEWLIAKSKEGVLDMTGPPIAVVDGSLMLVEKDLSDLTLHLDAVDLPVVLLDNNVLAAGAEVEDGHNVAEEVPEDDPIVPKVLAKDNNCAELSSESQQQTINATSRTSSEKNKGGRKKGSTAAAKKDYLRRKGTALTIVAEDYKFQKEVAAISPTGRVADGLLKKLVANAEEKHQLRPGELNISTILSRLHKNNTQGFSRSNTSPIAELEPEIVKWCTELARIGAPLVRDQVIGLANELILGTVFEQRLIDSKKNRIDATETDNLGKVGVSWYRGFLKRNSQFVMRKKSKIVDKKRESYCTYKNFSNMYDSAYESMVSCGVAEKLDSEVMFNKEGVEVHDVNLMFGRKSRYRLLRPEDCIYVDETGCNTNMNKDSLGGSQFVMPTDLSGTAPTGLTTDLHFTLLCFTNGLGAPVMCAIILKSEKEIKDIPLSWRYGVDERFDLIPADGEEKIELFRRNMGENQSSCKGGPSCLYKGKTIPCFVAASSSSSITSELLAEMLAAIDSHNVFDRKNGTSPFLLLDGHQSRLQLPFLRYINTEKTKWTCNIGVPYGTHVWQVADSAELNASFKSALTSSKLLYIANNRYGEKERFIPSDIIPLVNMAWPNSFDRTKLAKRAIEARGWGPLNYILLDHPLVKTTIPDELLENLINVDNQSQSRMSYSDISNMLNFTGSQTNRLATICIEQRMRNKAKNDIYLKEKEKEKENQENRQILDEEFFNDNKNWRSGKFASACQYALTRKVILEAAERRTEEKEKEKQDASERLVSIKEKQEERFKKAIRKYSRRLTLTIEDMKSLLIKVKEKDDGPLHSKKEGLMLQLETRKHRLDPYLFAFEDLQQENESRVNDFIGLDFLAEAVENSTSTGVSVDVVRVQVDGTTTTCTSSDMSDVVPDALRDASLTSNVRMTVSGIETLSYDV